MNNSPKAWGPPKWQSLHKMTFEYPDNPTKNEQNEIKKILIGLQNTLPCSTCRYNYKIHLKKRPLTQKILSSKNTLSRWLVDIHNDVNKLLKKPIMTYEKVIEIYQK